MVTGPRNLQDQQWGEAIHQALAAGEPIAPIVIDYNMSLAERAVPEWQATLDALQALPDIGVEAPIGYGGVSLGVVTGLMLTPLESRIAAVSFGGVFVDDALIEAAGKITVPVEYRVPWDDEEFDRTSGVALFDAFASKEKTLHAPLGQALPGAGLRARQLGSVLRPPPRPEDKAMSACEFATTSVYHDSVLSLPAVHGSANIKTASKSRNWISVIA